eukprot:CAMPEP_0178924244 /NCGR_PEP_ID=MMETSP0786-20121207/17214_1 /TAXON_ID=186022 /ORGANISM="Thalassionema frauenfeldii, Strain CCMP 1798" /LENGTH=759 /DNA_ID=CAMNT_0020598923 /DNA_START=195 /DNA_END=2474 /DNA_ORIENTATION=-
MIVPPATKQPDDESKYYDYHAMEEGRCTIAPVPEEDNITANSILCLEPIFDSRTKRTEHLVLTTPWKATTILELVQSILLPCGLFKEPPTATPTLSSEEMQQIQHHVSTQQRRWVQQLSMLEKEQLVVEDLYNSCLETTTSASTYNVKAAKALQDCDEAQTEWFQSLMNFVIPWTNLLDEGCNNSTNNMDIDFIWSQWCQTMEETLEQMIQHEQNLWNLANRPGVVPQLFLNVSHRSSFRTWVSRKLSLWNGWFRSWYHSISEEEEYNWRTWLTYSKLRQMMTTQQNSQSKKLDSIMNQLIQTTGQWLQGNFLRHGPNVYELQSTHQDSKLQRLSELMQEAQTQFFGTTNNDIATKQWKELRTQHQDLERQLEELGSTNNDEDNDDDDAFIFNFIRRRQLLLQLAITNITQWRVFKSHHQQQRSLIIPYPLKQWINNNNNTNNYCTGGGPRRFATVLASLIYNSLVEHCKEWHANVMQSELLESFDETISSNTKSSTSTKKKKNRKKKKGNKTTPATVEEETKQNNNNDTVEDNSVITNMNKTIEDGNAVQEFKEEQQNDSTIIITEESSCSYPTTMDGVEEFKEEEEKEFDIDQTESVMILQNTTTTTIAATKPINDDGLENEELYNNHNGEHDQEDRMKSSNVDTVASPPATPAASKINKNDANHKNNGQRTNQQSNTTIEKERAEKKTAEFQSHQDEVSSFDQEVDKTNEGEEESRIGVWNDTTSRMELAQDFLTARLLQLLSNDSNSNNKIIQLS